MRIQSKIVISSLLLMCTISCSTKKDAFLNRSFHAVTSEFNILYNGQLAFDAGITEINGNYEDDFWELLPIEPIKFEKKESDESRFGPGGGPGLNFNDNQNERLQTTTFDKAEEKAAKAIQRHSMKIYGVERNPQIDDAYFLLGKSRYYTQRFIPAIEAFNYVITKYPKSPLVDQTKVWNAKSNIRIDNEDLAIENLLELLTKEKIQDDIKELANTALVMAYFKKDSTEAVIDRLKKATKTDENTVQKARNLFILGQVYSKQNHKDSATITFKKLANYKKAPYKFRVHAEIAMGNNITSDTAYSVLINRYKEMIDNRDNRPYHDALYYQIGILESQRGKIENAIVNFKKSLRAPKIGLKQKSYSYEKLADIYFDLNEFFLASSYYDSILMIDKKESLRQKKIQRKFNSLSSIISYESIVKVNDSVLKLVLMTKSERENYFQNYVNQLKKEDEKKAEQQQKNLNFGNNFATGGGTQNKNNKGKWYFYNQQSISFGEGEFKKIWGNRPLEDNWRWSNKQFNEKKKEENQDNVTITQTTNKYDIATYIDKIPKEAVVIDSISYQRNDALYELGLIYKDQFKKYTVAVDRLERLLKLNPDESYLLPTYYLLYELYSILKKSKGDIYKNKIISKYPNSAYAQIILNPNKKPTSDKEVEEIRKLYTIAYNLYKDGTHRDAVCFIEMSLETIDNSILIPKFELLKAYCIGKYETKTNYKKTLEEVFKKYPNTKEGKKASEISKKL